MSFSRAENIAGGTVRVFLAEALLFPTGLITAAYLTRNLGPAGYGLFTLASVIVVWIEWSITAVFGRATFKFVGEAQDWKPVGSAVVRLHIAVSVVSAALLWLVSVPVSRYLTEPDLAGYLRLYAIDIPLFSLAQAHRNILVGIGAFHERALVSATRWIARLALILAFVYLGLSVRGAILGCIGASVIELIVARLYIRPPIFRYSEFPLARLWDYALPLFLFALSLRIYDKLDLVMLKALGGTAELAGIYGAAQNLSLVPGVFALSFSPLLLSSVSRALISGQDAQAREMGVNAIRVVMVMIPFAGMAAGASHEITQFVFGSAFVDSAPLFSVLFFGATGLAMISVTTAILTAAGRPALTFLLIGPLVPLAFFADLKVIPRYGATGAAAVTTGFAIAGALATLIAVYRHLQIAPPAFTFLRSLILTAAGWAAAAFWPAAGILLVLKLAVISSLILLGFFLFGEMRPGEAALLRRALYTASHTKMERE